MRDFRDAKTMARDLRRSLAGHGLNLTHSQTLELIAQTFGYDNWNILAAKIEAVAPAPAEAKAPKDELLHCSFCGKSQQDVKMLIAGPKSFICDACVGLCEGIIGDNEVLQVMKSDEEAAATDYPALHAFLAARTADDIEAYLARSQKDAETEGGLIRTLDGEVAAMPAHFQEMSADQRARRRSEVARKLELRLRSFEVISGLLAARA